MKGGGVMDAKKVFQTNLNSILADKGMKQVDLAKRLGCTEATVSNWCLGIKHPRITMIDKIASALGVSTDDLLTDTNTPNEISDLDLLNAIRTIYGDPACEMLKKFSRLDNADQWKAIGKIEDLLENEKYSVKESCG